MPREIPSSFICSITGEIMSDPVSTTDGQTYERTAITQWLVDHNTSPNTRIILTNKTLTPNYALKSAIEEFLSTTQNTTENNTKVAASSVQSNASQAVALLPPASTASHDNLLGRRNVDLMDRISRISVSVNCNQGAEYLKVLTAISSAAFFVWATVFFSTKAAALNGSEPDKIGVLACSNEDNLSYGCGSIIANAVAHCGSILSGYINSGFVKAAGLGLPAINNTNTSYQLTVDAMQFACGGLQNISIGNSTFNMQNKNVCDFVSSYGSSGSTAAEINTGTLQEMFKKLVQITGNPMLNLICENGDGFAKYVTLAVFSALAVAMCGVYLYRKWCCEPKYYVQNDAAFFEIRRTQDRMPDETMGYRYV